jgi:hypothetical protein
MGDAKNPAYKIMIVNSQRRKHLGSTSSRIILKYILKDIMKAAEVFPRGSG